MNEKLDIPKRIIDPKRAKRFVDSVEEGDNLVSPLEEKNKDRSIKATEKT